MPTDEVMIGLDPNKASNTIAVLDRTETVLNRGRFDHDEHRLETMLKAVATWPQRIWAVGGGRGMGWVATSLNEPGSRRGHSKASAPRRTLIMPPATRLQTSQLPASNPPFDGVHRRAARYRLDVAQNIYDDEAFFSGYSTLQRSVHGHDGAPEWPTLRDMVPDPRGQRVLDLGCGFGWFSRWAADKGAAEVLGIDLSERMLTRARAETSATTVSYKQHDLDLVTLPFDTFDIAYSSLTLHYLEDLAGFFAKVHAALQSSGVFVFSVEHPLFTAPSNPGFVASPDGSPTWPVDRYMIEGTRVTSWFAPGVVKQHRTIGTYINSLIETGFHIDSLIEWGPTKEQIAAVPAWANEIHRPPFLLIRAHRP